LIVVAVGVTVYGAYATGRAIVENAHDLYTNTTTDKNGETRPLTDDEQAVKLGEMTVDVASLAFLARGVRGMFGRGHRATLRGSEAKGTVPTWLKN
jgi:hypothetical protein